MGRRKRGQVLKGILGEKRKRNQVIFGFSLIFFSKNKKKEKRKKKVLGLKKKKKKNQR